MSEVFIHADDSPHHAKLEDAIPRYQSHKVVGALKIGAVIEVEIDEGIVTFEPEDKSLGIERVMTRPGWLDRFEGDIGADDLGYWVQYEDGFSSWSPTDAFESGYSRI